MKKKFIIAAAVIAAPLLCFLLWPLDDEKYAISFNRAMIDRKNAFLEERRRAARPPRRPNIIILIADDLGMNDISLYGGMNVQTPNIDAIGREGATFNEAYCTSSISSPSRAGMLTGRYQQRFGHETQPNSRYPKNRLEYYAFKYLVDTGDWKVADADGVPAKEDIAKQGLPPSEITLAELLSAGGYDTAISGKWHLGYNEPLLPGNRGFARQYGCYEAFTLYAPVDSPGIVNHRHDYFADRHIWSQERKGPCAIMRNGRIIDEKEYLTFAIAREAVNFIGEKHAGPFFLYVPFTAPHTPFQATKEYYDRFAHVADTNKRTYYAMIAALDDAVGMITRKVKEAGLDNDTVIFFASDNGGATYTGATDNAPLKGGKFTNFEGGLGVPCAMRWKGRVPAGTVYRNPVSLFDFFTTCASAAGSVLPGDREIDGVDLLPYLTGKKGGEPHRALFWRAGYNRAVRMGQWKLIMDERTGRRLLYDMTADRIERRDLSAENPDIVEKLAGEFSSWEKGMASPAWPRVMDYRFVFDGEEFYYEL